MREAMKALGAALAGAVLLAGAALLLVPLAIALWITLRLGDRWGRGLPAGSTGMPAPGGTPGRAASLLILNWNGRELLARLLPSVRAALAADGGDHEVIVIDNGSTDGSREMLAADYPEVRVVAHECNEGFVGGYNKAWDAASRDIVVLLNNDMVVDAGFLGPLLAGFDDPSTFAVTAQIFFADPTQRREETGLTGGRLTAGLLKLWHDDVTPDVEGLLPTLWAGGGSTAFDRRKLLELGGFDPMFAPFYFEDTALSFAAWQRGWNVWLAPAARVVHAHQSSSARLPADYVARIKRRNQHLFTWGYLSDPRATLAATLLLPGNVARLALTSRNGSLLARSRRELGAVLATVPHLRALLRSRQRLLARAQRSTPEVFALAQSRQRLAFQRDPTPPAPGQRLRLLFLLGRVPRHGHDGSWSVYELLRALATHHEIHVFTLMDRPDDAAHVERLRSLVARVEAHPIEREVGVLDLHHAVPPRLLRRYTAPALRRRLATLLRTTAFDLVQVDYLEMATLVGPLIDGLPSVHVVHEPLFRAEQLRRVDGWFAFLRRWWRSVQAANFEARLYSRYAQLVCLSQDDAERLRPLVPGVPIAVNPVGADTRAIQACGPSRGATLLAVGYFGHHPNVDAMRWFVGSVFGAVRAAVPDVRLRIAGGDPTAEVAALASVPGVEVLGFVADLGAEMAACALTIAPVREGAGLRTKVIESFAYGRAVVATPQGAAGITGAAGHGMRVAADAPAFAAAIIDLLGDEAGRHAMERAARELVLTRFSAEKTAERAESIYREVLLRAAVAAAQGPA